jgi:3-methyladenine DNA glycosylase AlkD
MLKGNPLGLVSLRQEMKRLADKDKARVLQGFFKTGPGEYGEGDIFLGIVVPVSRQLATRYREMVFPELKILLDSPVHEERLVALLILVDRYAEGDVSERERVYNFYLKNMDRVNNWDLVDLSAHKIVGPFLENKSKTILSRLACSKNLWHRRIAILSTFHYIKKKKFSDPLKIAHILVNDSEDLIQKAVGWMLREIGKLNLSEEEKFLKRYASTMPRTMLRYAIERFPEKKRRAYLQA